MGFFYTSFEERTTFISHGNTTARHAKEYEDLNLAQICGTIATDEKRHDTAYPKIVEKLFEIDPNYPVLAFDDMMRKKISTPAHLMCGRGGYDGLAKADEADPLVLGKGMTDKATLSGDFCDYSGAWRWGHRRETDTKGSSVERGSGCTPMTEEFCKLPSRGEHLLPAAATPGSRGPRVVSLAAAKPSRFAPDLRPPPHRSTLPQIEAFPAPSAPALPSDQLLSLVSVLFPHTLETRRLSSTDLHRTLSPNSPVAPSAKNPPSGEPASAVRRRRGPSPRPAPPSVEPCTVVHRASLRRPPRGPAPPRSEPRAAVRRDRRRAAVRQDRRRRGPIPALPSAETGAAVRRDSTSAPPSVEPCAAVHQASCRRPPRYCRLVVGMFQSTFIWTWVVST
ncbi:hypothetical protein GUJ93_ZPchr0004g39833 [Zizania palustris]|uniref:Stearoyl-[acyl-carrier-protein] 9-desaturase n=1 Tax=Zizania palustris TaxID=103762 RepID=A0A8J5SRB4_ZIZPA|nr:hypothetical protein GUJ93_ZPchr0004g39833 [Zizania palustris]